MTSQQQMINSKINEIGDLNAKKRACTVMIQSDLEEVQSLYASDPALSITKEDWLSLHKRISGHER